MKAKYHIGILSLLLLTFLALNAKGEDSRYFRNDNSKQVVNNYYGDYDYYYSSRINRFHRSYAAFGYYAPVFTDSYWYNYQPFSWGISIYGGGFSAGYNFHWPDYYGYGDYWGYDPYFGSSYYFGYNPYNYGYWYPPVVINLNFGHIWHNNYYGWNGHHHDHDYYAHYYHGSNYYSHNDYHGNNYNSNRYSSYSNTSGKNHGKNSESSVHNNDISRNRLSTGNEVKRTHNAGNVSAAPNKNRNNSNLNPSDHNKRTVRNNNFSNSKYSDPVKSTVNRRAVQYASSVKSSSGSAGNNIRSTRSMSSNPGVRSSSSRSESKSSGSRSGSSGEKSNRRR
jgi:hypothetical protein